MIIYRVINAQFIRLQDALVLFQQLVIQLISLCTHISPCRRSMMRNIGSREVLLSLLS